MGGCGRLRAGRGRGSRIQQRERASATELLLATQTDGSGIARRGTVMYLRGQAMSPCEDGCGMRGV